ncbi:NADH-quinone oxidoreductase subunit J [Pseudomonas sp. MYb185]|uniref:NADH-quinone oxidoreductase subunit J n=1 Tax=Pseudomonas sp. MYb185 TaxID=1848729 RepID=UPI000CFD1C02|nr:NADH-quinone oxidoreductase subunit J [Pseudomonas sp. MYb185]PRB76183.1 NADH-quinone oxidoreductase subunit J [Pseudomonas sp. MYb185]
MEFAFYFSAGVAVAATLMVITNTRAVHALLYLVTSLLAVSMCFFSLGAPFAGVLEIIVYAGAIMVLFVFVVMMLNLGSDSRNQERQWLSPRGWIGPGILSALLLAQLLYVLFSQPSSGTISGATVDAKAVGIALFGPYILAVELAAMMLLAAMVTAFHIGRHEAKEVA